jgi:hypothetical protein
MLRYLLPLLLISTPALADGYLNPEFTGKSYKRILVTVPVEDLGFRQRMETTIIKYMEKYVSSVGVGSLDIFMPFVDVSNDDYKKKLNEEGLEAVLVVNSSDSKESFPPNYKHKSETFTTTYVGSRWKKPISAIATLYDVSTGKTVWVLPLDLTIKGRAIIKELSYRPVKHLLKAKLLQDKVKEPSWFSKSLSEPNGSEQKNE